MALPKITDTPRGRYLQEIINRAPDDIFEKWPMPTRQDLVTFGLYIMYYSYIDFQLRRTIEVVDVAGLLPAPWKGKTSNLTIADVERAVKSAPDWSESNRVALAQIEDLRRTRNLIAHFAVRRFPDDDAFVFMTRSARDFDKEMGYIPNSGMVMTITEEASKIAEDLKTIDGLLRWLTQATNEMEEQYISKDNTRV
jgi:hypothetical protein